MVPTLSCRSMFRSRSCPGARFPLVPYDDVGGIEGLERCLPPVDAELTLQLQRGLTWRVGSHDERAPEPRERRIAAASDASARQPRQILLHFWQGSLSRRAAFPDRPRLRRSGKPAAILESWSESDADPCRSLSAARVVWQATGKAGMIFHLRRLEPSSRGNVGTQCPYAHEGLLRGLDIERRRMALFFF
jgi:hypothetical protein